MENETPTLKGHISYPDVQDDIQENVPPTPPDAICEDCALKSAAEVALVAVGIVAVGAVIVFFPEILLIAGEVLAEDAIVGGGEVLTETIVEDAVTEEVVTESVAEEAATEEAATEEAATEETASEEEAAAEEEEGPKIHEGKQGKHQPGHNNFKEGRSELTHEDPQGLLDKGAGNGTKVGENKEVVDFEENIGNWVGKDGTKLHTTRGTIHYDSSGGAHIVPAHPTGLAP